MEALKRCYLGWIQVLKLVQPVFLLAVRVLIGWGFVLSGWGKLTNVADTAKYFAGLHIPMPELNAYLAGTAETVGGALLILGAASRVSTIPLIGTMIVAYATDNKAIFGDLFAAPSDFVKEFNSAPPLPYLMAACVVLFFGPGLFSVDGILKWLYCDRKCPHESRREAAAAQPAPLGPVPHDRGEGHAGEVFRPDS